MDIAVRRRALLVAAKVALSVTVLACSAEDRQTEGPETASQLESSENTEEPQEKPVAKQDKDAAADAADADAGPVVFPWHACTFGEDWKVTGCSPWGPPMPPSMPEMA